MSTGEVGRQLPRVLVGMLAQLPAVWVLAGLTFAPPGLRPRASWGGWAVLGAYVEPPVSAARWAITTAPRAAGADARRSSRRRPERI